jgi:hypothetical protein
MPGLNGTAVPASAPAAAAKPPAAAPPGPGAADVHLVVIQHGLWGNRENMMGVVEHFERALLPRAGAERIVLENSGAAPGRGGGERLWPVGFEQLRRHTAPACQVQAAGSTTHAPAPPLPARSARRE